MNTNKEKGELFNQLQSKGIMINNKIGKLKGIVNRTQVEDNELEKLYNELAILDNKLRGLFGE
jgi:hypothetical protein